jgi:hypothetical protein
MATRATAQSKARIKDVDELGGYITVARAKTQYNIPSTEFDNYIQRGGIPAIRLNSRCLMVKPEDVETYLATRQKGRPKKQSDE